MCIRDRYYILYIASFGLYQVSVNGAGVAYFWPDSPWWANAATPMFIGAAGLFGCQFARSFLQVRNHSRAFDAVLKVLMGCGALAMLLSLTSSYGVALRLATAVDFDDSTRSLPLGQVMQVFEDRDGNASIAQVSAPSFSEHFRPHRAEVLNAGYSSSVFWLKIQLRYTALPSAAPRAWLLELAYPPLDHLELYLPDASGTFRLAQRTGDALPYASRQIKQNNYLFELPFAPGQTTTAYLRLHSQGSVQAPLTLWSAQAYMEAQPTRLYVLGLIYGVLLGMLVYNLFIYLLSLIHI